MVIPADVVLELTKLGWRASKGLYWANGGTKAAAVRNLNKLIKEEATEEREMESSSN